MKIIGILLFLFGGLLFLGGAGGAVFNFFFMEDPSVCQEVDRRFAQVEELELKAKAARGTPLEADLRREYELRVASLKSGTDACAEMLDQRRMYGIALAVAGVVGFLTLALGAVLAIWGFRRKKALA